MLPLFVDLGPPNNSFQRRQKKGRLLISPTVGTGNPTRWPAKESLASPPQPASANASKIAANAVKVHASLKFCRQLSEFRTYGENDYTE